MEKFTYKDGILTCNSCGSDNIISETDMVFGDDYCECGDCEESETVYE